MKYISHLFLNYMIAIKIFIGRTVNAYKSQLTTRLTITKERQSYYVYLDVFLNSSRNHARQNIF